jgi:hypothetical protein
VYLSVRMPGLAKIKKGCLFPQVVTGWSRSYAGVPIEEFIA